MESKYNNSNQGFYKNLNYYRGTKNQNNYHGNKGTWNYPYYPYYLNNYKYYYSPKYQPYQSYSKYQPPYYNEYELQRQLLYRAEKYITSKYPDLLKINNQNTKLSEKINEHSKFLVIKALTEEDIHKSIKYNVWSSTKNGNITLNNYFNTTKNNNGDVYLFFTSEGTERYVGVARMESSYNEKGSFDLWTQDNVWIGLFSVKWLFIKDVPFKEFKNIIMTMKDGEIQPVFNAKNMQEIPYNQAKIMIEKIDKYQNSNTILEHFEYYDNRQKNYEDFMKTDKKNQNQDKNKNNIKNKEDKKEDN